MRNKSFRWFAGGAGILIAVMLAVWWGSRRAGSVGAGMVTPGAPVPEAPGGPTGDVDARLRAAAAELAHAPGTAERQQALASLRQALASLPPREASAAIRRFLDSKMDAPTQQGFKIGAKGQLTQAPSLRTFLLDYLGQIDPAGAAEYARVILGSADSSDEWALALKNLALGDTTPEGKALLEQKAGELLQNEAWQKDPSVGYLEAFDAAVFLGGTNFAPTLADLVRQQDNPAVAHAAYLALDRMVINQPAALLAALESAPTLMQGREATRADYFARADVRDPQQRQVLESYLLDPQRSAAELAQFGGVFPNANYMISHNLLTPTPTPDHSTLASLDAASLQAVQDWLADPRFANLQAPLQKAKQRLETLAKQAGQ